MLSVLIEPLKIYLLPDSNSFSPLVYKLLSTEFIKAPSNTPVESSINILIVFELILMFVIIPMISTFENKLSLK